MRVSFLTVRFPLMQLIDPDLLEKIQDLPLHEKKAHLFYQTDSQAVAEKLVETFQQGAAAPATWSPCRTYREWAAKVNRGECSSTLPPVFGVLYGAKLKLADYLIRLREVEELEKEIEPYGDAYGDSDPLSWELPEEPDERLRMLLMQNYALARKWEARIREELGLGQSASTS